MFSKNFKEIRRGWGLFFALVIIISLSLASQVEAASLSLSPASSSYLRNKQFVVTVYVNSDQQSLNAVAGTIAFPKDKLEVLSVSKSGTIFNFWVQEPSFSNASGKVNFEGVVLNPGFKGSAGKLISITFKTKAAGEAKLSFGAASILANDGKGTNILNGTGVASFSIKEVVEVDAEDPLKELKQSENLVSPVKAEAQNNNFLAPVIRSISHPDNNLWYNNNIVVFHWDIPTNVKSLALLLNSEPNSSPAINYSPPVSDKTIKDLEDGIWYLHASFKYDKGVSSVTHFPIRIDTKSPVNLSISPIAPKDVNQKNEALRFLLAAEDSLSGIDYYEIAFDQQTPFRWSLSQGNIVDAPALASGNHEVSLSAIDKAGNRATIKQAFSVQAPNMPVVSAYPSFISSEEPFILKGSFLPSTQVQISLSRNHGEDRIYIVPTDINGQFSFILEKLSVGNYQFRLQALSGQSSNLSTDGFNFSVKAPFNYSRWLLILLIISLFINIFILISHFLRRCRLFKKTIKTPPPSTSYRMVSKKVPNSRIKAKKRIT